ncbi:Twitching mobility protein [Enhygromyxa salina]|uniref:Twitching mobility protein n=1 Tax=Enhygromyxa salina TaxID=215803 RepID=A0A2S9XYC9_9BACT|nr:PilT/PilU family type 4a pilus ATPase [Enhygromyxa salina]PRP97865.1 Twitching mobility protein [Enhygromyxa salina]
MIVDGLLEMLQSQGADTLILQPSSPPVLSRAGERRALSMPGLGPEMLAEILAEFTNDADRAVLEREGSLETQHETGSGLEFAVAVKPAGSSYQLVFRSNRAPAIRAETASAAVEPPRLTLAPSVKLEPRAVLATPAASPPPTLDELATSTSVGGDPTIDGLLERGLLERASDVLISHGRSPHLRIGGDLVEIGGAEVSSDQLRAYFGVQWPRIAPALAASGSADFAIELGSGPNAPRFRVNLFRQIGGLAAAFRPIRRELPTLEELGLGAELHALTAFRHGLVLMTGPTGSGKSTTLVALLERVNQTQPKHIITIEDPIEYVYPPGRALVHQRELGVHVDSFSAGLRAALRECPDMILVGEMRDRETVAAALTAAETGHLVLSTLHCSDASSAVNRIIDVFPEHRQTQVREQLAASLRAVVTQSLIPGIHAPRRVAAYELMRVNTPVAAKIRDGRGHQLRSEIQKGRSDGMIPLELTLARLVRERRLSEEVARRTAHDPRLFDEHLRKR